jgi:hypothetical protein
MNLIERLYDMLDLERVLTRRSQGVFSGKLISEFNFSFKWEESMIFNFYCHTTSNQSFCSSTFQEMNRE